MGYIILYSCTHIMVSTYSKLLNCLRFSKSVGCMRFHVNSYVNVLVVLDPYAHMSKQKLKSKTVVKLHVHVHTYICTTRFLMPDHNHF